MRPITQPCELCGMELYEEDFQEHVDGQWICYHCLERNFYQCSGCEDWIYEDDTCDKCNHDE